MHMLQMGGGGTISICGRHQDQGGGSLLGRGQEAILGQGLLNSLGQLLDLPLGPQLSQGKESRTCMPYVRTRLRSTKFAHAWNNRGRRASNKEREREIRKITKKIRVNRRVMRRRIR